MGNFGQFWAGELQLCLLNCQRQLNLDLKNALTENFTMSMTTCPTCQKPISNNAYTCPHCGETNTPASKREYQQQLREEKREREKAKEDETNNFIGGVIVFVVVFAIFYLVDC
ncbi:hypothetical protein OAK04_00245 [Verrucomicrobia bacterium]|nr:hypothetical protein [Verrucomicrobiota bacterium]